MMVVLVSLAVLSSPVMAYNWPLAPLMSQHPINGTFGEYRGGDPPHLHNGVDIDGYDGQPVYCIDSGVTRTWNAGANSWVRVGEKFYLHLADPIPDSMTVTPGTQIGKIYAGEGHVHLREGYDDPIVNPLRSVGLTPYTDTSCPVVLSIEVVQQGTPGGGTPFPDTLGCPKVQGRADIKVTARDPQSNGSLKTAPYKVGYEIRAEDGAIVEPALYKIQFNTVDGHSLGLVYSETESDDSTYVYWATNRPDANEYWDSEDLWDGWYWIYAYAEDIAGNESSGGSRMVATERLRVWVDGNIAARLVAEWAYRSGGGVVVGWNAEVERKTAGYLIEGKRDGAWYEVGRADRADAVAPGLYSVEVGEDCERYRVVEVDSLGRRQEFRSFGVSNEPPSYLAELVENALAGEAHAQASLGCCLAGADEVIKALDVATETVPDWVIYGPDSLLAECGPAVSWFESKGHEVVLVGAPVPDH
jgi:hypothetical protein